MKSSEHLEVGATYSRNHLRDKFSITDASLNNGVFRPKDYDSVWLFVTEKKTPDRTEYIDLLEGDVLHWDGQRQGRTDKWIIEYRERGTEILLFYREHREQYSDYAFRYEGAFEYVSHTGSQPAHFILRRKNG